MKKLGFLFLIVLMLSGCAGNYDPDYTHQYVIEVTYMNGDIDTITHIRDSFKGNEIYIYLKSYEPGVLADAGTPSCVNSACGFYDKSLVCGVRKFQILSHDTIASLPKKSWEDGVRLETSW